MKDSLVGKTLVGTRRDGSVVFNDTIISHVLAPKYNIVTIMFGGAKSFLDMSKHDVEKLMKGEDVAIKDLDSTEEFLFKLTQGDEYG